MTSTRAFELLEQGIPLLAIVAAVAGALWAGILFSVSWLSGHARWMADVTEMGGVAISLNRRWATPCLVVCISCALLWATSMPQGTVSPRWVSAASLGAVALVAVHSSVSRRAAHVAHGNTGATRGEGMRRAALVMALAALAALVAVRIGQ